MCVLLITRLLRGVGRRARKLVNHTSWVAVVTPTDRPKSVRNCCLIKLFCGVVCVDTLPLWHFCWYRGFCHRTGSPPRSPPFCLYNVYANSWTKLDVNTVNVVIFAGEKFRENGGKIFHVGVVFTILLLFPS